MCTCVCAHVRETETEAENISNYLLEVIFGPESPSTAKRGQQEQSEWVAR